MSQDVGKPVVEKFIRVPVTVIESLFRNPRDPRIIDEIRRFAEDQEPELYKTHRVIPPVKE